MCAPAGKMDADAALKEEDGLGQLIGNAKGPVSGDEVITLMNASQGEEEMIFAKNAAAHPGQYKSRKRERGAKSKSANKCNF